MSSDARHDPPRLEAWRQADRRVRRLDLLQLLVVVVAGLAVVASSATLGHRIIAAQQQSDRAADRHRELAHVMDDLDRVEVLAWRSQVTEGDGFTPEIALQVAGGISRIRALAEGAGDSDTPAGAAGAQVRDGLDRLVGLLPRLQALGRRDPERSLRIAEPLYGGIRGALRDWNDAVEREARTRAAESRSLVGALTVLLGLITGSALLLSVATWTLLDRARRRVGDALRASEDRFRSLVQDLVLVVDPSGRITYCSPSAIGILGRRPEEVRGARLVDLIHPDDADPALAALGVERTRRGRGEVVEWRMRAADDEWVHLETVITDLRDDPATAGLVLNGRDISDRVAAEERLEHQAFHDALTDLPNRALFEDRVRHALVRGGRDREVLAVLLLDLDDFKTVNDSLGHGAGDQLLVWAADRVRSCLRESDTPARLGGDEFAVLLEGVTGPEEAMGVARRMVSALAEPLTIDGHEVLSQASVGVAVATPESSVESLLRNADVAMYVAKSQGKGRPALFEASMETAARERLALKSELRHALARDELVLHFQPIIDLPTGRIVAAEALVRWEHPARGLVPPAEFIPLAEETGLIRPIGAWVLREACAAASAWRARGSAAAGLGMSVNLSARQLEAPELIEEVRQALDGSGLDPSALTLEITESVLMIDIEAMVEPLRRLRELGVRIAIDDFGTGYSSLRYLGKLPVDVVKIDKSFVDGVAIEGRDSELAEAIVRLGETLRLDTVAEGVEEVEQVEQLRDLHCRYAQGFYFSRPVPGEELSALLDAGHGAVASARGLHA